MIVHDIPQWHGSGMGRRVATWLLCCRRPSSSELEAKIQRLERNSLFTVPWPEWWNIERSQEWSSFLGTQFWQDYACSVEFGSVKWYNIWFCPKTFGLSFKCRYIGAKPHFQTNPNIPYCVGYVSDFDPLCIISMYVCIYIYIIMYVYIYIIIYIHIIYIYIHTVCIYIYIYIQYKTIVQYNTKQ